MLLRSLVSCDERRDSSFDATSVEPFVNRVLICIVIMRKQNITALGKLHGTAYLRYTNTLSLQCHKILQNFQCSSRRLIHSSPPFTFVNIVLFFTWIVYHNQ